MYFHDVKRQRVMKMHIRRGYFYLCTFYASESFACFIFVFAVESISLIRLS